MVVSKEDAVGPFAMGCQRHQTMVVSKEDAVGPFAMGCQRHQTMVVSKEDAVGPFAMRMPEASNNGSQPYSRAYGYGEMAGTGLPLII